MARCHVDEVLGSYRLAQRGGMRSIYRALKLNGQVVRVDFDRVEGKSSDWILNHLRAGTSTFVKELELAGFEVVEEREFVSDVLLD